MDDSRLPIRETSALRPPPAPAASGALEALRAGRLGAEYQPIVEVHSGRPVAHEALARFYAACGASLAPAPVFAALRRTPALLLRVELALKGLQLRHAPAGPLFVNLDAAGFAEAGRSRRNLLLEVLRSSRSSLVIEALESRSRQELRLARGMMEALHGFRLPVALDDVGAPGTLLSPRSLRLADVVKLDRSWLAAATDAPRLAALAALVRLARRLGKPTVLEGVERPADLALARDVGVDLVQGFLFRERFRSRLPEAGLLVAA